MTTGIRRTGTFLHDPSTGRLILPHGLIDSISGDEYGALGIVVIHDYIGDAAHSRELGLEADCDLVLLFPRDSISFNVDHLAMAYALRTVYGAWLNPSTTDDMRSYTMGAADASFQGKMTGADATKVKLGSSGAGLTGTNAAGYLYTVIGMRFRKPKVS